MNGDIDGSVNLEEIFCNSVVISSVKIFESIVTSSIECWSISLYS